MSSNTALISYRIATEHDFKQIHRLNYRAFVQEIPQHAINQSKTLIDKFHDQNTYIIASAGGKIIGMVALRGERPFSLDSKLDQLDTFLPNAKAICELRLLYVVPEHRRSTVFYGLARALLATARQRDFDLAIVSATLREMRLYRHLGFVAFGPEVGTTLARYQPMWLDFARLKNAVPHLVTVTSNSANFSTGPVALSGAAKAALSAPAISHRSGEFATLMNNTRKQLLTLTGASDVAIICGSGTTANDMIAQQILARFGGVKGLVLVSGEFGERLLDQANRAGLDADALRIQWGNEFTYERLDQQLSDSNYRWIWSVHCETSTGALVDLEMIKQLSAKHKLRLYLDCMSTVGTMTINLQGVCLASASSGKGVGSVAGLALVFSDGSHVATPNAPSSLSLSAYTDDTATPFTLPSSLLAPLWQSVQSINDERYEKIGKCVLVLRANINQLAQEFGFTVVTPSNSQSALITIALPDPYSCNDIGQYLELSGIKVGFESAYLRSRNWMQFAVMGGVIIDGAAIMRLVDQLRRALQMYSMKQSLGQAS
jgi:aspartate aminotransferase-like enzyme/predicted N-acetyltransferase YhbS